ncbi:MAG: hypothetical protein GC164_00015 [Phycisphaera sp.]|nr:hypothetical protein [Phycisphaera sp.]
MATAEPFPPRVRAYNALGGQAVETPSLIKDLNQIASQTKYPVEAFLFVQRGLDYTVRRVHGNHDVAAANPETPASTGIISEAFGSGTPAHVPASRHVTGRDLCLGLRDFAIKEYGLLARAVLKRWHVTSCEDFGHIVFTMVDSKLMMKTDEDTIGDFIGVFDFSEAFSPQLSLK